MNGLFPFQFVGLVNLKHYGFEAVFLWMTAEISQIKLILSVLPHSGELLRWYSRSREQCYCAHIPFPVASPQRSFARSFPSCWNEIQNHLAKGHESAQALHAAQEQWMQDRAETRTGCLPSVTVLSQRHRNCWCLMACAAPEQQESAVSSSKTIFPIRESAAAWMTFQNALKSALEKEGSCA